VCRCSLAEGQEGKGSSGEKHSRRDTDSQANDFISNGTAANWTSFFAASSRAAPQSRSLHACQLALDCIMYPCEGPLGATIITMLRGALPGEWGGLGGRTSLVFCLMHRSDTVAE
jgi:hypothetical protein